MATLGFDNYIEPLKNFLTKYKEVHTSMPPCSLMPIPVVGLRLLSHVVKHRKSAIVEGKVVVL